VGRTRSRRAGQSRKRWSPAGSKVARLDRRPQPHRFSTLSLTILPRQYPQQVLLRCVPGNYSTAFLLAFAALMIGAAVLAAASLRRCVSFAVRAIAAVASSNRVAKFELTALSDETISALSVFKSERVSAKAGAEPRDRTARLMAIILLDRFP
jgi:hypothetical protein